MSKRIDFLKIMLAVVVMLFALFVRLPSAFVLGVSDEAKEAYTDETGLPYFTDPDSYYHVRLVDTMLKTGRIGDTVSEDGEPWDMHSFYPEGRSAVYQPGIVYLTIGLWKLFNLSAPLDISRVEFYLPGIMAMFTALVAFVAGFRINGNACGFIAGILTGCAPDFVARTSFGRFDTDIFVVLMNVLLIITLTEMLRTNTLKERIGWNCAFILTAIVYANCWATQFSMLFVGLTIFGGLIYAVLLSLRNSYGMRIKDRIASTFTSLDVVSLLGTGLLILTIIGLTMGFSVVRDIFGSLTFDMTQEVSDGVLPNMFESIAELQRPCLGPDKLSDWFKGYVLGNAPTVVTGVGGVVALAAAACGLIVLCLRSIDKLRIAQDKFLPERECMLFFVVLGVWTLAGLCLTRLGVRFIEMLTAPIGILAGIFVGWLTKCLKSEKEKRRIVGSFISAMVIIAIIYPCAEGVMLSVQIPSVTDASAETMRAIKDNAIDRDAVLLSWWDMGYYYESESGHPCMWDGGTQDSIIAILYSRAMMEGDMEMSCRILDMLANSGNRAVDLLMEHMDAKRAFAIIWEVLPLDTEKTCDIIIKKSGMNNEEAHRVEAFIHPQEHKEAYLVLSNTVVSGVERFDYYSNWDFTGTQAISYADDESENMTLVDETRQEVVSKGRFEDVMRRLFFDAEETIFFIPEYENYDGVERLRVWRIHPVYKDEIVE